MPDSTTDADLLREYTTCGSERAFRSLVERHVNLVFATALRRLGDAWAAEELTQDVFIALARKAVRVRAEPSLAGWLHRTTVLAARQWWRKEVRRQNREQMAVELGTSMKDDNSLLKSLAGVLDKALMELRDADRQVLLLRYCEERSHREIGELLGTGEDAVRKRASKALKKLSTYFRRRGYAVPSAVIATALGATQTAPASLAAVATQAALSAGAAASAGSAGVLILKIMGLTKSQAAAAVGMVLVATPIAYQGHALWSEGADSRRLEAELPELRHRINDEERTLAALQRELRATEIGLGTAAPKLELASAATGFIANPADLYLWDEHSEFVRLPKSLASRVTLSEVQLQQLPKGKPARVQLPAVAKDGAPSPVLLAALGLTPKEAQQVEETTRTVFAEFAALADQQTYFEKQAKSGNTTRYSYVTPAFPDEGARLSETLRDSLVAIMGDERTEVFWHQAEPTFGQVLNEFGAAQKEFRIVLRDGGEVSIEETFYGPDGKSAFARSRPAQTEDIPASLKQIVEAWQASAQSQTEAEPK